MDGDIQIADLWMYVLDGDGGFYLVIDRYISEDLEWILVVEAGRGDEYRFSLPAKELKKFYKKMA